MADISDIKKTVQERYGKTALRVISTRSGGCGPRCCGNSQEAPGAGDPISGNLYDAIQTAGLPAEAVLASLGCGNPTALAELKPGEVVLDLGAGQGLDVDAVVPLVDGSVYSGFIRARKPIR